MKGKEMGKHPRTHAHIGACGKCARETAPESVPPLTGMPPTAFETAADVVTEYGQELSGGGYQTWNTEDYIEEIYPLARKIANERRHGKVWRRRIIVVEDWEEVDAP